MGQTTSNLIHISTGGLIPKSATKNMFGGGQQAASSPLPLPQAPSVTDASAKAEDVARKKRSAMSQSIYTSPLGVSGEANIVKKTLLGQ